MIRFEGVTKRFGDTVAVDAVELEVREGEFFALLGPSGCGKTTLLRMLAGFETPSAGRILLAGEDVVPVPPHRRPVNMMFQSYALFPHLTVAGNVAFGLKQERLPRDEIAGRVAEMLRLVRLEAHGARKPHQLSGGQRQRVALARALAKYPKVLLLDEPLAALDKKLREETQFELMELQAKLGTTFLIVTHDQEEAMTMAHRIAVMNQGRLAQVGEPGALYEEPASRWVAAFVGDVNLIEATVTGGTDGLVEVVDAAGRRFSVGGAALAAGEKVALAIRPEKITLHADEPREAANRVTGRVGDIGYLGDVSVHKVRLADGTVWKASLTNATRRAAAAFARDDAVWLSFPPEAAVVLTQ